MEIQKNISLKPYNTFGIDVKAKQFVTVENLEDLQYLLFHNKENLLIIGGGSNVLFTKDFNGLVVNNQLKGIKIVSEDENTIVLKVAAGEVWHKFVLYCVDNGYAGVENMSLIPGSVGASPMQNIGAYGVEVKDVIVEVEALNILTGKLEVFKNEICEFGYRTSIFKTSHKNDYFITSVTFILNKQAQINTSYGAIQKELETMKVVSPTIKDVSDAVISIRESKLPNPQKIGNSGSFFKNPVISQFIKNKLIEKYPELPNYLQPDGSFKVAAGWLIEKCGWKGKVIDDYGVHKNQALVLVNYGGAKGIDIYGLSTQIITSVQNKFNIILEREVNIF